MKPKILFFARSFHNKLFSEIKSDFFEPIYVVLTHQEKDNLELKGKKVHGCFEDEYNQLEIKAIEGNYLKTSFSSDRFLKRFNHDKRLEILGKEISFWRNLFETLKPDYVVSETVAIEISEVMAIEAERLNIPFLNTLLGLEADTFYFKPNPFHGSVNDLSNFFPSSDKMERARKYISNVIEKNQRPVYISSSSKSKRYSVKSFLSSLLNDAILIIREKHLRAKRNFKYEDYTVFAFRQAKLYINSLIYRYDKLEKIENKNIVFFPLHYEPEATLSYFAEEYFDQPGTIIKISRAIKTNQLLVIKEHPQQPGALLQKKFRNIKKITSNVIFLPSEVSSFEVLKKSEIIVTLTSTAAWEGVLMGKPVLVLGKIFFDQCPGVIKINDYNELKVEIRKENYQLPEYDKVLKFVASFMSICYKGSPHIYARQDFKQITADYTRAIEAQIK